MIIVEDDSVLFAGNDVDDYYYSIGGGVHLGETSGETVKREVFEEKGVEYEVDHLAVIHANFFIGSSGLKGVVFHYFKGLFHKYYFKKIDKYFNDVTN